MYKDDAAIPPSASMAELEHASIDCFIQAISLIADRLLRGLMVLDDQAMVRYCNQPLAELLGKSAAMLVGQPLAEHLEPRSQQEFHARWLERQRGSNESYLLDWRAVRGRPLRTSVLPTPIIAPDGRFLGSVGLVSAGLDHHRFESELALARRILEGTDAVLVRLRIAPGLPVERVSQGADRLGLPVEDLREGRLGWLALVAPEAREELLAALEAHSTPEPRAVIRRYAIQPPGGARRWIESKFSVHRATHGEDWIADGLITDVTAQDEAHRKTRRALIQTIHALGAVADQRDRYTARHQQRVATLALSVGQRLQLESHRLEGLYLGSLVHDIGKIGIPSELLAKPGRLTPEEFALVKTHVLAGCEIMDHVVLPWPIREMIAQHHERLDGSGYPHGVAGDAITLEARIIAVADVFEAMSEHRPYRVAPGIAAALDELERGAGTEFDPAVVAACREVVGDVRDASALWTALEEDDTTTSTVILPLPHDEW